MISIQMSCVCKMPNGWKSKSYNLQSHVNICVVSLAIKRYHIKASCKYFCNFIYIFG